MVALAPRGSRSRVWLRDKLWSDRGEDQASASLRQSLFDIRQSFGAIAKQVLISDNHTITLNMARIRVDALELLGSGKSPWVGRETAEWSATEHFLEGIDVRDPEFEDWLTLERQVWLRRLDEAGYCQDLTPKQQIPDEDRQRSALVPETSPARPERETAAELGTSMPQAAQSTLDLDRWSVALMPPLVAGKSRLVSPGTASISAIVATTLLESGLVRVVDLSHEAGVVQGPTAETWRTEALSVPNRLPVALQIRILYDDTHANIRLVLARTADNSLIWSGDCLAEWRMIEVGDTTPVHQLVNRASDAAIEYFVASGGKEDLHYEARLFAAMSKVFRLSRGDLEDAEATLRDLLGQSETTQAYAWLAFLMTFRVGQRFGADDSELIEQAQYLASRALELGHDNALSLALIGHIHSYLFGEFDFAAGLFEQSLRFNPAQPLAWDLYAMLHCYAGKPRKGLSLARWARHLGAASPHRYYFDVSNCISAALAAEHRAAIDAGNAALYGGPEFNSVLRFLVSSHAHLGDIDAARELLARLTKVEPGFAIESLFDARYPGLETAGGRLFIDGLRKAGVRQRR